MYHCMLPFISDSCRDEVKAAFEEAESLWEDGLSAYLGQCLKI